MRVIRCPQCNGQLPGDATHCASCGFMFEISETSTTIRIVRPRRFRVPRFSSPGNNNDLLLQGDDSETVKLARGKNTASPAVDKSTIPRKHISTTLTEIDDSLYMRQGSNWHKVLETRPLRPTATPRPPTTPPPPPLTGTLAGQRITPVLPRKKARSIPPQLFFWISMLLLVAIVMGGFFGLFVTFGSGILSNSQSPNTQLTLQVTPTTAVLGTTITLRGAHFTPYGHIGLTRDADIPFLDTSGKSIISANANGSFTDTVLVTPLWQAGSHLIHAEDALLHKTASFTIIVTGQSPSQRPPHLLLSVSSLDLGSGNQATNSLQAITLSNAGGGQVSWQTATTQSWLMVSPKSGTFSAGQTQKVMVAVDRANLKPGAYSAKVIFTASTGEYMLPVTMKTSLLVPGNAPVLQLTPPLLAFTGGDGGASPPAQVVTVSNPGTLPLQWSATTSGGDGWLTVTPTFGNLSKGGSQPVTISVNTSSLLPGFYDGWINFTSEGSVATKDSPQSIYFSLIIVPQCILQVSPGNLSFTSVYQQTGPAAKLVNLSTTQECTAPLHWSASAVTTSGGSWLSIATTGGTTPSYVSVSVSTVGLTPGIYTGTIIFSASTGTQTLFVSFILAKSTMPLLSTSPTTMSFSSIVGQSGPSTQTLTVTNTGGGRLAWQASATTAIGGAWLTITPNSGTLAGKQPASIGVTATWQTGMTPGAYSGAITINGTDSVTGKSVGTPQTIAVTLAVQPPCTLQAPSTATETFNAEVGTNPSVQSFTIGIVGTCSGNVTLTPTATGGSWLAVSPGSVSITSGSTTFTVTVTSASLVARQYSGSISIAAIDGGIAIVNSPQTIAITLNVIALPVLAVTPASLTFNMTTGINTLPFTISNAGGEPLNWTATLASSAPGFVSLSTTAGNGLAGGTNTAVNVIVNATGLAGGSSYSTSVTVNAIDPVTGHTVSGSPTTVAITINVAVSSMQLNTNTLTYTTTVGVNPQPQTITLTNNGGDGSWSAGAPSQSWVTLNPTSGTISSGSSESVTFTVDVTGLGSGPYSATVVITPTTGNTITVTINLTIS